MFSELGLHEGLVATLTELGYENPTPVQKQAIPAALEGRDLMVSSHTGSGKTAAFLLPSLQRMIDDPKPKTDAARLLILTPTRELAQQIEKAARNYGREVKKLNTACLVGGSSYHLQLKDLGRKPEILICTPGRLLDHIERGRVNVSEIETLVLDEADRMLDMGFSEDIESIVSQLPETRQTLLFSATLEGVVGSLARRLTRDPMSIEIETAPQQEALIEQRLLMADNADHKARLLDAVLRDTELQQAVVFTATKRGAEELADRLSEEGFSVDALHGDMHQRARNMTLQKLRQGRINVLVATDVAARGIDVAGISHVINFDTPRQVEDYVHRIGRTGRAGRSGIAITLAEFRERRIIRDIERYTGQPIQITVIPGLEPTVREERRGEPKRRYGKSTTGGGGGRFKNGQRGDSYSRGESFSRGDSYARRDSRPRNDSPRQDGAQFDAPRNEAPRFEAPRNDAPRNEAPRNEAPRFDAPRQDGFDGDAPRKPRQRKERPAFDAESAGNTADAAPRARKPREREEFSPRKDSVRKEFGGKRQPRDGQSRSFQPRDSQPRDYQPRDAQPRDYQPRDYQARDSQDDYSDDDSRFNRAQPQELAYHERDPALNFTARQVEAGQQNRKGAGKGPRAQGQGRPGGYQGKSSGGYQGKSTGGYQGAGTGGYQGQSRDGNGPRNSGGRGKPGAGLGGGQRSYGNKPGGARKGQRDGGYFSRETGYGPSEVQEPRSTRQPRIIKAERPQRTVFYNEKVLERERGEGNSGDQPPRKKLTIARS